MPSLFSETVETETSTVEDDKAVMAGRAAEAMRPRERRLDAEMNRRVACIAQGQKIDPVEIYETSSDWTEILYPKKILDETKLQRLSLFVSSSPRDWPFACCVARMYEGLPSRLPEQWMNSLVGRRSDETAQERDAKTAFVSFRGRADNWGLSMHRQHNEVVSIASNHE